MNKLIKIICGVSFVYLIWSIASKFPQSFYIFNQKWVKGLCRHFCSVCEYTDTCDILKEHNKDYARGFNEGYALAESYHKNKPIRDTDYD